MKLEVSPGPSADHGRDVLATHAEHGTEVNWALATGSSISYIPDLIVGEFGCSYLLPSCLSSLRVPVGHIVSLGPEEQVGRIDAERDIAMVENTLTLWYRTMGIFVGNSMGANPTPVAFETPISSPVRALRPQDAVVHDQMVTQ